MKVHWSPIESPAHSPNTSGKSELMKALETIFIDERSKEWQQVQDFLYRCQLLHTLGFKEHLAIQVGEILVDIDYRDVSEYRDEPCFGLAILKNDDIKRKDGYIHRNPFTDQENKDMRNLWFDFVIDNKSTETISTLQLQAEPKSIEGEQIDQYQVNVSAKSFGYIQSHAHASPIELTTGILSRPHSSAVVIPMGVKFFNIPHVLI